MRVKSAQGSHVVGLRPRSSMTVKVPTNAVTGRLDIRNDDDLTDGHGSLAGTAGVRPHAQPSRKKKKRERLHGRVLLHRVNTQSPTCCFAQPSDTATFDWSFFEALIPSHSSTISSFTLLTLQV